MKKKEYITKWQKSVIKFLQQKFIEQYGFAPFMTQIKIESATSCGVGWQRIAFYVGDVGYFCTRTYNYEIIRDGDTVAINAARKKYDRETWEILEQAGLN